jgi:putative ABC transport system permease protein
MNSLLRDVKCAFRVLLKSRGFTSAAVMSLAIGIGASSAVFSVVHAVLIRALPYDEPRQLMALKNALLSFSGPPSYTNVFDWNENAQSFSDLAAYSSSSGGANLTDVTQPERIEGAEVTASFFTTLGVNTVQGRVFQKDEDQPGKNAVVVISYGFWQRRFGDEQSIVGRSLTLNGKVVTVIGIAPFGFEFPSKCDFWIPVSFGKDRLLSGQPSHQVIGRLKPGIERDQAQAEINVFIQKLKEDQPGLWVAKRGIQVIPLLDQLVSGSQTSLLILSGFVVLVLLIACSNVTNLFLARAANRKREIAIRVALGAGRIAMIQQLIVESLLLSFVGGVLGLIAGSWLLKILIALIPNTIPRINEVRLDTEVVAFTLVVSIMTACLVGLAPALQALKVDINESLKEGALRSSRGPGNSSVRSTLVVSEIVLTVVILAGTGLLLKSLIQIHKVHPGFDPDGVITLNISLPETQYSTKEHKAAFFQELISRVRSIPGTLSVGAINFLPFGKANTMLGLYEVEGQIPSGRFENQLAAYLVVTPDYLSAMGIPLIQGRYLAEQDTPNSLPVVLIDQTIAKNHWPNDSPIGKRLMLPGESTPREIIGVTGTVQHLGLDIDAPKEIYLPYTQSPLNLRTLVIRTNSDPVRVIGPVRDEIQALDKNLPIYDIATMHQRLDESTVQRRFIILLFSVFAGAALILAAVGIYGVMSYTVAQRTHEIGIRIALGAQQSDVLRLVLGTGLKLALIGVAIGIGGSLILTQVMSSMLFGITAFDPATLCLVSIGILGVALLASYLPAVKATRVDPIVALRNQ